MNRIKADAELLRMAQMGMAALLPGMQYAQNFLQREIDRIREELAEGQRGHSRDKKISYAQTESLVSTANLQRKTSRGHRGTRSWVGMTPEERSAEMARRVKKARAKKSSPPKVAKKKSSQPWHPRLKEHPDHQKWIERITAARKRSVRELKKAVARKTLPNGQEALAS